MRHRNHRHQLGVKKEHREALIANLARALFLHGRIETTLANAKALRPFAEKIITLAKDAASENEPAKKVHFRRQAIRRVRSKEAVTKLFNERVNEFLNRSGGYTRIYKLVPRKTDAAAVALIELINADDSGIRKSRKKIAKRGMPSPRAKEGAKETLSPVSKEEKGA